MLNSTIIILLFGLPLGSSIGCLSLIAICAIQKQSWKTIGSYLDERHKIAGSLISLLGGIGLPNNYMDLRWYQLLVPIFVLFTTTIGLSLFSLGFYFTYRSLTSRTLYFTSLSLVIIYVFYCIYVSYGFYKRNSHVA